MKTPTTLIIMDGYGIAPASKSNAVTCANTPVLDKLFKDNPHTQLEASGIHVGLPAGQIGNSEVGHTNIGAGRVVYQELTKITREIETGKFFSNKAYVDAMETCAKSGSALHIMGLMSFGGVHSHNTHIWAFLEMAKRFNLKKVYLHCFTDGRDTSPRSGKLIIEECVAKCKEIGVGKIATVIGRFYAMDRDNRWNRIEKAYNAMVCGEGDAYAPDPVLAIQESYDNQVTDEFISPIICDLNGIINPDDSVIFANFRPDRARQITRALVDPNFDKFERKRGLFPIHFVCTTQYEKNMPNVSVAYPPETLENTLGSVISDLGLSQLRIAETEKYAHVTFFFNGGLEQGLKGEDRILVPSPNTVPTYDLIPEMSAYEVTQNACSRIRSGKYDLIILNFANCDMVGHTGVIDATIKAVETVDFCLGKVVEAVAETGGISVITADHGNAEVMRINNGLVPQTSHSTNPVPFIVVGADVELRPGKLADIAPTLLQLMDIEQPKEMTGKSLIKVWKQNLSHA